jgi:tetratricopeptide (TPR) repeat protein
MGLACAAEWAERLEQDNLHDVNALYLRKAIRLELGDWEGAERFRRQAELLALRAHTRQMFENASILELTAHAMARDLTGLKQVMDRIEPLGRRSPSWLAFITSARGHFRFIAASTTALSLPSSRPSRPLLPRRRDLRVLTAFPLAAAGRAEALIELGRVAEARDCAERALAVCAECKITVLSHAIARALALAEAKAGDYAGGSARLDRLICEQTALGVTGLHLGTTYEARARIAIWAHDALAIQHFGRLTAREPDTARARRWQRISACSTNPGRRSPRPAESLGTRNDQGRGSSARAAR